MLTESLHANALWLLGNWISLVKCRGGRRRFILTRLVCKVPRFSAPRLSVPRKMMPNQN